MHGNKTYSVICSALIIVSVITAGVIAYCSTESIVKYEFSKAAEEQVSGNTEAYNTYMEYIPYSDSYRLHLKDGSLYVKNDDGDIVYVQYKVDASAFSESDAYELNGNGILFRTRSELIETLNYLNS